MDDFSVYGKTFEGCMANLDKVLERCHWSTLSSIGRSVISWSEKELSLGIKFQRKGSRWIRQGLR
jgi:hypothetical protein